jgi:hypothetical protein
VSPADSATNVGLIVSAVGDDTTLSVVHPVAAAPVTVASSAAVVGTTALEEAVRKGRSERAAGPSRPNPRVETVGATAVCRSPLGPTEEVAVILRWRRVAKLAFLRTEVVAGLELDVVAGLTLDVAVTAVSAGEAVAVAAVGIGDDTRCLPRREKPAGIRAL